MTPELQAFYDALELLLRDDILVQAVDILSFALGACTGLAFVTASAVRFDR
jgi:hypothetical protein